MPGAHAAAGGGGTPTEIATLPAGSTLYRADWRGKNTPSTTVPVFLGDKVTIEPYTVGPNGQRPLPREDTISSYKTTKDLRLFVMSKPNFEAILEGDLDDDTRAFIRRNYLLQYTLPESSIQTLQKHMAIRISNPVHAIRPDTESMDDPETGYGEYSNRRLARILCDLGFDGWVSFPNTLLEYANRVLHYYTSEIVLCRWDEMATRTGGRRSRRRRTRRKRRL